MEPENLKPNPDESKPAEAQGAGEKAGEPVTADSTIVDPKIARPEIARGAAMVDPKIFRLTMTEREFARLSRRELLKVVPVLALGAFAIPSFQDSLLKKGLAFSDWASARLYRRGHLAPTFADSELTPPEKSFPSTDTTWRIRE